MGEVVVFHRLLVGWMILALVVFIALFFFTAPYGRYHRSGWGFSFGSKLGWIFMEAPAPCIFFLCAVTGSNNWSWTLLLLLLMWECHYIHRAFIYPFRLRGTGKRMPLTVVGMGLCFNTANAFFNGYYLFTLSHRYGDVWLRDPRLLLGLILFGAGFILNRWADQTLRGLRASDEAGYKLPVNGMFRYISCPNYFGEIVIWLGWATATWSLPGLAFALWTMANLIPRAWKHHAWYRQAFTAYPPDRKALVPWLW